MNLRSHSRSLSLAALALLAVLGASLPATVARADRVVLYPIAGRASEERAEAVEQRIVEVLGELGHRLIAPPSGGPGQRLPSTSAEMRAAAEDRTAQYVVTAEMDPLRGQYRLHVMVYYAPAGRMEELVVTVDVDDPGTFEFVVVMEEEAQGGVCHHGVGEPGGTGSTGSMHGSSLCREGR